MSNLEKKEKNLNQLINKLNALTSTYSHSPHKAEKIQFEKNELKRQKTEIEKKNQELLREHRYLKKTKLKICKMKLIKDPYSKTNLIRILRN